MAVTNGASETTPLLATSNYDTDAATPAPTNREALYEFLEAKTPAGKVYEYFIMVLIVLNVLRQERSLLWRGRNRMGRNLRSGAISPVARPVDRGLAESMFYRNVMERAPSGVAALAEVAECSLSGDDRSGFTDRAFAFPGVLHNTYYTELNPAGAVGKRRLNHL